MKQNEENDLDAAIIAAIIIVVTMLLFPIFVGENAPSWRDAVRDYQTLWAGVLAVGAAVVTIRRMKKDAAREDERHSQVLFQANLPNYLAILRLIGFAPSRLSKSAKHIESYAAHANRESQASWDRESMVVLALALQAPQDILDVLNDRLVSACEGLFTPTVTESMRECRAFATLLAKQIPVDFNALTYLVEDETAPPAWFNVGIAALMLDTGSRAEQLVDEIRGWSEAMLNDLK